MLNRGMTLIETLVYVALLGGLCATFIPYVSALHDNDMKLFDEIIQANST